MIVLVNIYKLLIYRLSVDQKTAPPFVNFNYYKKNASLFFVFFLLYPFLIFSFTVLPNNWTYFSLAQIAAYTKKRQDPIVN